MVSKWKFKITFLSSLIVSNYERPFSRSCFLNDCTTDKQIHKNHFGYGLKVSHFRDKNSFAGLTHTQCHGLFHWFYFVCHCFFIVMMVLFSLFSQNTENEKRNCLCLCFSIVVSTFFSLSLSFLSLLMIYKNMIHKILPHRVLFLNKIITRLCGKHQQQFSKKESKTSSPWWKNQ